MNDDEVKVNDHQGGMSILRLWGGDGSYSAKVPPAAACTTFWMFDLAFYCAADT